MVAAFILPPVFKRSTKIGPKGGKGDAVPQLFGRAAKQNGGKPPGPHGPILACMNILGKYLAIIDA